MDFITVRGGIDGAFSRFINKHYPELADGFVAATFEVFDGYERDIETYSLVLPGKDIAWACSLLELFYRTGTHLSLDDYYVEVFTVDNNKPVREKVFRPHVRCVKDGEQ